MDDTLRQELEQILTTNDGKLGVVARLWIERPRSNRELAEAGGGANQGAAANTRATVQAVLEGIIPTGPSVALQARSAVSSLIKQNLGASAETLQYLADLRNRLEDRATNAEAVEEENEKLEKATKVLEEVLEKQPGVYVYTTPTYFRSIKKTDPDRSWFKVGKTDRAAGVRIGEQMRATGLPEDPYIARVYRHPSLTPKELEDEFHRLLDAAGHGRSHAKLSGKEWFTTNLEFLDAIASALTCEIAQSELND
jgi:T5orf172 domain